MDRNNWESRYEEIVEEVQKVLVLPVDNFGYSFTELMEIFGTDNLEEISQNNTVWDIYNAVRKWKLSKSIKVGSIVICHDDTGAECAKGVVIDIDEDRIGTVLTREGTRYYFCRMMTNTGMSVDVDNIFSTVDKTVRNYKRGLI